MFAQQLDREIKQQSIPWERVHQKLLDEQASLEDIETDSIRMSQDGTLIIDGVPGYRISDEAESQIFNRFAPGGIGYLKKCPNDLKAFNLNFWAERKQGKQFIVRTKETPQGSVVRGILTERYAKLDNLPIFESLFPCFQSEFIPVDLHVSDTQFHLRLARKTGIDISTKQVGDMVHSGAHISNSETGMGAVRVMALSYRLVCKNGMISYQEMSAQSRHHIGNDSALNHFFQKAVSETYVLGSQLLEWLKESHQDRFEPQKAQALIEYIGRKFKWQEPFIERLQDRRLVEDTSKFGLIQAITGLAQEEDYQERLRFERQAGELLPYSLQHLAELAWQEKNLN